MSSSILASRCGRGRPWRTSLEKRKAGHSPDRLELTRERSNAVWSARVAAVDYRGIECRALISSGPSIPNHQSWSRAAFSQSAVCNVLSWPSERYDIPNHGLRLEHLRRSMRISLAWALPSCRRQRIVLAVRFLDSKTPPDGVRSRQCDHAGGYWLDDESSLPL